jgi:hypothetical protein
MRQDAEHEAQGFAAARILRLLIVGAAMLGVLLGTLMPAAVAALPAAEGASDRFCRAIAAGFDRQQLTVVLDPPHGATPLLIDINGDGDKELVSLHSPDSGSQLRIVNPVTGKAIPFTYPLHVRQLADADFSLIRSADRIYILIRDGKALSALFRFDARFTYVPVCSFRQTGWFNNGRNQALSAYEIILLRSEEMRIPPYHYAINRNNLEEIQLLAAHRHPINARGKADSDTDPLSHAVWQLEDDTTGRALLREMLRLGANPNPAGQSHTPLETAALAVCRTQRFEPR